jgi:hypothetical protein
LQAGHRHTGLPKQPSSRDRAPANNHANTEASHLDYLEVQPHTVREEPFSATETKRFSAQSAISTTGLQERK